uniref:Dehydrogenase with different specificities related to short-chain alcohol dehydrogenase n=1 Tax=Anopheles atroparvus TaxID=41427 RepID=A0AAG5D2J4_ANOAO
MGWMRKCCILVGLGSISYLVRYYFIGRRYVSKRTFQNNELIVITGANSGIGLATFTDLVGRGCHLVIGTRCSETGRTIRDQLLQDHPAASIDVFELRLESLASVVKFSESVRELGKPLYALINNAGVFYAAPSLTEDNLEYTYQVNYLSHFLLTLRLLPLLKQHPSHSRIVNVASQAHLAVAQPPIGDGFYGGLFEDSGANRFRAYQYSKFCLVQFSYRLAQLLATDSNGVSVHCVDPGNVETAIYRHFPHLANRVLFCLQKPLRIFLIKTPYEGAQGILFAVLSEQKPPFYVRQFWAKQSRTPREEINPLVYKVVLADSLWRRSRQQCNHHLLEMII